MGAEWFFNLAFGVAVGAAFAPFWKMVWDRVKAVVGIKPKE